MLGSMSEALARATPAQVDGEPDAETMVPREQDQDVAHIPQAKRTEAWAGVIIMVLGAIAIGVAVCVLSWALAIGGIVIGVIGAGLALHAQIFNHFE